MKILFALLVTFIMSGCKLNDLYYSVVSEEVDKMCDTYSLYICHDKEAPEYTYTTYFEARSYAAGLDYKYTSDNGDSYDYMLGDLKLGDCEDYVITLMEDFFMLGYIDNAIWMYGQDKNNVYHAWLLIDFDGETYIFDTWHRLGVKYADVRHDYHEIKIVMRF